METTFNYSYTVIVSFILLYS